MTSLFGGKCLYPDTTLHEVIFCGDVTMTLRYAVVTPASRDVYTHTHTHTHTSTHGADKHDGPGFE